MSTSLPATGTPGEALERTVRRWLAQDPDPVTRAELDTREGEVRDYAVDAGLRMFEQRHVVATGEDGLIRIAPGEERLVAYYANAIAHLV